MTIATQEVLFGVTGQSLVLELDEPIISVASVTVFEATGDDTGSTESATTGSSSIGSVAVSTDAAAGPSTSTPTRLSFGSADISGLVTGRRYIITIDGATGGTEMETVIVESIDTLEPTTQYVYTRHPLVNDYEAGASIYSSNRATIAVSDSWSADTTSLSPAFSPNPRYRVKWVVSVGQQAEKRVVYTNLDLVRYSSAALVSPVDVDDAFPGWLDRLPPDHRKSQGRALIAEAVRSVKLDLYHRGIADQALRNAEVHAALVIDRTILATAEDNALRGAPSVGALEMAQARYDRRLAGLVDSPRLALDTTGGGAAKTETAGRRLYLR